MIKEYVEKVISQESLSVEESYKAMSFIMEGGVNNSLISSLLTALKMKGETPQEIAGFAKAMRDNCIKPEGNFEGAIDLCGTGGDNSNTFNISTAAAFVVAGAGLKVAKHGNRSVSSSSGSADVLTELGININMNGSGQAKAMEYAGLAFYFAPVYHPAMKNVAGVRKELALKTVFNILGPLTNPAGTKKQLIGTYNYETSAKMSEAASLLDMERVCFVCTEDKYDEVTLSGETRVCEYKTNGALKYNFSAADVNYPASNIKDLKGSSPRENASIIYRLLSEKEKNAAYYVVAANAGFALYAGGYSDNLQDCFKAAEESIDSGTAFNALKKLRETAN